MPRAQRLGFLAIAALVAVAAVVLLGGSGGDDPERGAAPTAPTPADATPTPTPTAEATRTPAPVSVISADRDRPARLRFTQGETVRFRVRSSTPDEVHVHGYDVERPVGPGQDATIAFRADITGIFEVELHSSERQIAQLRVDPR